MTAVGIFANMMGDHQTARSMLEHTAAIHRRDANKWYLSNALLFLAYEVATSDLSE